MTRLNRLFVVFSIGVISFITSTIYGMDLDRVPRLKELAAQYIVERNIGGVINQFNAMLAQVNPHNIDEMNNKDMVVTDCAGKRIHLSQDLVNALKPWYEQWQGWAGLPCYLATMEGSLDLVGGICLVHDDYLIWPDEGRIKVWDIKTGKLVYRLAPPMIMRLHPVTFPGNPRGARMRELQDFSLEKRVSNLAIRDGSDGAELVLEYSMARNRLRSSSEKLIQIWNLKTGECLQEGSGNLIPTYLLDIHDERVIRIDCDINKYQLGKYLIFIGDDRKIRVWTCGSFHSLLAKHALKNDPAFVQNLFAQIKKTSYELPEENRQ